MINAHLVQRLSGIQQTLLAQHASGVGLPDAVVGAEREVLLREFLQRVFPSHRRFTTGAITDSAGGISGQIDIAVEYPFIPSFPMPATEERLMLAESVAVVLEVKSDLSAQWSEVVATTEKVKALRRQMNPTLVIGRPPPATIPCIAIGYHGQKTLEGLAQRLNTTPEHRRPDAALVIESGCFVGFGMEATGPVGLYALCVAVNSLFQQLGAAAPDLLAYAQGGQA